MPKAKLATGAEMPLIGLGTWKGPPEAARIAVEAALRQGSTRTLLRTAFSCGVVPETSHNTLEVHKLS
jgi:diketogulonate reductase-like aldo/keto reductase